MIIFEPISRNAEEVIKMPMRTRSGLVVDPRYSYVQPDNTIIFSKQLDLRRFYHVDWRGWLDDDKTSQTNSNRFICRMAKHYIMRYTIKYANRYIK